MNPLERGQVKTFSLLKKTTVLLIIQCIEIGFLSREHHKVIHTGTGQGLNCRILFKS